jgi:hypothetical protein
MIRKKLNTFRKKSCIAAINENLQLCGKMTERMSISSAHISYWIWNCLKRSRRRRKHLQLLQDMMGRTPASCEHHFRWSLWVKQFLQTYPTDAKNNCGLRVTKTTGKLHYFSCSLPRKHVQMVALHLIALNPLKCFKKTKIIIISRMCNLLWSLQSLHFAHRKYIFFRSNIKMNSDYSPNQLWIVRQLPEVVFFFL